MKRLDELKKQVSEGRLSRREFMQRTAALGVAAGLSSSMYASAAHASTPKRGGHVRVGWTGGSTTDSLDPIHLTSTFTGMLFYNIGSQLTEITSEGQLGPELAESWEANQGATEWTFNLRQGVEFHNGKTLDADDVIASIDRQRGEDSQSATKSIAETITEMRKDGPNRVIFTLQEGNADFPVSLSAQTFYILPVVDGQVQPGIGTGGYMLDSWDAGVRGSLKRHPNFFREDRAFFDSVEITVVADPTSRQTGLVTGEFDIIDDVPPITANLLAKKAGVKVLNTPGLKHYTFPMRLDMAPFMDNNDLRLALKYAFDRQDALDRWLQGYGALGNDHPISPANRFYAPDIPQREYDPDKAKFHLKKAGMEGFSHELSGSDFYAGCMDLILLYKEHAAKAGIEIIPNRMPTDGYWSDVWLKHPWSASFWSGRPTEDWMFTQAYGAESNWNETYWKHERFNMLLREARAELDEAKRRDMYGEMQLICRDEGGSVIPLFASWISAHSDKIAIPEAVAGNWAMDGYKYLQRWWFA